MGRSAWVLALGLSLPAPLLAALTPALADALGTRGGRALANAGAEMLRPRPSTPAPVYVEALEAPAPAETAPAKPETSRPANLVATGGRSSAPKKGIRVRADAVLRLARTGARPAGFPVPADGTRPRGLALTGVSALGIGLQDGDVLTHAAGRPATSAADVIGVVIGSRRERAPEICGRFWRNGETWDLVVEQPYLRSAEREAEREPRLSRRDTN